MLGDMSPDEQSAAFRTLRSMIDNLRDDGGM